jgi:tetratricopeptide (TPR) repeat protein
MVKESGILHAPQIDPERPWLGLQSFTEGLQGLFHGRDHETDELFRRVGRKRLTVLFGQSGLGKTSLLRAGLFPKLRSVNYLPVSLRIDYSPTAETGSLQTLNALMAAAQQAGVQLTLPPQPKSLTLWELFHHVQFAVKSSKGSTIRPVVVFDQFEEGFAIGQITATGRKLHGDMLIQLADLIEGRVPESVEQQIESRPELVEDYQLDRNDYRVIFSLREDYLAQLEDLCPVMPSIAENRMRITRMNGQQAVDAVRLPGGHLISVPLSEQVVRFVAGDQQAPLADKSGKEMPLDALSQLQVEPALLSLFCQQLNNRRIEQQLSQITPDLLAGNREHILNDFYKNCLQDMPVHVQRLIEDELLTDSGYRESIAMERAERYLSQNGVAASTLDTLIERRLLHVELRGHVRRVELTHDVLTEVVHRSRAHRQQVEADQATRDREAQLLQKYRENRRRFIATISAMTAVVLLVGAVSIFALYQWRQAVSLNLLAAQQTKEAEQAKAEAIQRAQEAEAARADAVSQAEQAKRERDRADVEQQRASQEAERALREADEANRQRDRAAGIEKTARQFSQDSNRIIGDIARDYPQLREAFYDFYKQQVQKLEDILKVSPDAVWAQQQLAYNLTFAAENAQKLNRRAEALEYAAKAVQAVDAMNDDTDTPRTTILALGINAGTYKRLKEFALAEQALQRAFSAVPQVPADQVADGRRWEAYLRQMEAEILSDQNRPTDSLQAYQRAIELHEAALLESECDKRLQEDLVGFLVPAADVQLELKQIDDAIRSLTRAKQLRLKQWKESDSIGSRNKLAEVFEKLGMAQRRNKDLTESRTAYQNAENARRGTLVVTDAVIADDFSYDPDGAKKNLARCLQKRGEMEYDIGDQKIGHEKLKEAIDILRDLRVRIPKETHLDGLSMALVTWADLLSERAEKPEAEKLFREALETRRVILKSKTEDLDAKGEVAFVLARLASCMFDQGKYEDASQLAGERLQLRREIHAGRNDATSLERLVSAMGTRSFYLVFDKAPDATAPLKPEEALQTAREALDLDPNQLWIRTNEAHGLLFTSRFDEAAEVYIKYANEKLGEKTFGQEVLNDFSLLRKSGIDHPDMARIEALLPQAESSPSIP